MRKTIVRLVLATLFIFGFIKVLESNEQFTCPSVTVTVQNGDTVSDLLKENGCTGNLENARNKTVKLIGGSTIYPGQTFTLPSN
jgi:hypothetical protein